MRKRDILSNMSKSKTKFELKNGKREMAREGEREREIDLETTTVIVHTLTTCGESEALDDRQKKR